MYFSSDLQLAALRFPEFYLIRILYINNEVNYFDSNSRTIFLYVIYSLVFENFCNS